MKIVFEEMAGKHTKNAYRFMEAGDPAFHKIGALYVKKTTLGPECPATLNVELINVEG